MSAIRVRGTITITQKNGRRGAFNVGELRTEIGHFEVKDALIEEYEEGTYNGDFFINWIEPESFTWKGKVFIKNVAQLEHIAIDEVDQTPEQSEAQPPAADPADTPATSRTRPAAPSQEDAPGSNETADDAVPADRKLFGAELFALLSDRQPIKLDPTVDRVAFRSQRDRLKDLAYNFDPKLQVWNPPTE